MLLLFLTTVLLVCYTGHAATLNHDFNLTWTLASPDGFTRPVIGVNNIWPPPTITATLGDTVVINVHNQLGNQSSSLHFHGLFMNGTNSMDGTSGIVQCAIPPDGLFKYEFTVDQVGTYWYHSHQQSQYPDGLRGALVVHDPNSPLRDMYDDEILLTLSDWYHEQTTEILPKYMRPDNNMLTDPKPDAYLLNDTQDLKVHVQPGSTYLVRLVNMGAFEAQKFWINEHELTIVEVDGVYTKSAKTNMVSLTPGQRCAFLVSVKDMPGTNYALAAAMDRSADRHMMSHSSNPEEEVPSVTGWLVSDPTAPLAAMPTVPSMPPIDDFSLEPYDEAPLQPAADTTINLVVEMKRAADGLSHWMFNTTSYIQPKIPTLFSAETSDDYDPSSIPIVLPHNSIIDLIIYNKHMSGHPFHIHGHTFQVAHRSAKSAGRYNPNTTDLATTPIRRDTIMVPGGGSAVLRFRADNPGVWFFHCHMEWHAHSGLALTFVEAPERIRAREPLSALGQMSLTNLRECVPEVLWPVDATGEVEAVEDEDAEELKESEEAYDEDGGASGGSATTFRLLAYCLALFIVSMSIAVAFLMWRRSQTGTGPIEEKVLRRHKQNYSLVPLSEGVAVDHNHGDFNEEHESIDSHESSKEEQVTARLLPGE